MWCVHHYPGLISIHVPTRGTTNDTLCHLATKEISIHVPTRGTTAAKKIRAYSDYFNPRAHEGHDRSGSPICIIDPISIHVPTRGTTWYRYVRGVRWLFQSTCPRGARLRLFLYDLLMIFQSTCPRGARRSVTSVSCGQVISIHVPTRGTTFSIMIIGKMRNFNPRAHEGHDKQSDFNTDFSVFQSTCPRGARRGDSY